MHYWLYLLYKKGYSKTFQKQLRTVWQLQKSVSYCLFGSKKHLISEFATQEVIHKYQLSSSANVSIVKRALIKKELIEIEKRRVVIPDPVMKVWLKKELGI